MAGPGRLNSGFVITKCSKTNKNAESDFESVSYVSYKPKIKNVVTNETNEGNTVVKSKQKSVDMRKLRFEVIKLGTSGMDPVKKEASAIAMAVALGAKPPSNEYKNYKQVLKAKREEKHTMAAATNSENVQINEPVQPSKRHLYVVGTKVIPAKTTEKDNIKNFLEGYGRPGKMKKRKGFKRKRQN